MSRPRHWLRAGLNIALVAGLLTAVSFLPPDNSLSDVRKSGQLKLCVPPSFPPLVTGDPAMPGYDIELARAIADQLGVRLAVNVMPSIGKDFNPRNWFLTRAQCDMVGGGVADTVQTRSYMQTIPTDAETGWIGISRSGTMPEAGSVVAVLPGTTGLDRLSLSSWLREQKIRGQVVRSTQELEQMLESGSVAGAVTERFTAAGMGLDQKGFRLFWLDEAVFPKFTMAFGMWKGDQTLRHAVQESVIRLENAGLVGASEGKYGLAGSIDNGLPAGMR